MRTRQPSFELELDSLAKDDNCHSTRSSETVIIPVCDRSLLPALVIVDFALNMAPASSPRRSIHGRSRVAVYTNSPYVRVAAIVVGTIGVLLLCMSYKVYTSDGLRATSVNLAEGNLRVPDRAIVDVKSKESNDNGKGGADFGPPVTFRTCVNSNHIALTFDGTFGCLEEL